MTKSNECVLYFLFLLKRVLNTFTNCLFSSFDLITMNANVRSVGVKDVDQSEFVKKLADFLKKSGKLKVPEWVDLVKTGVFKELAPFEEDWFYIRSASVARHLYLRSPVGVGSLTKIYGGRYRKGTRPSHYCRGSSNIARKSLQALEGIKWVEKDANTGGRRLTRQGYQDLDRIAAQLRSATKARLLAEQLALSQPPPPPVPTAAQ